MSPFASADSDLVSGCHFDEVVRGTLLRRPRTLARMSSPPAGADLESDNVDDVFCKETTVDELVFNKVDVRLMFNKIM